MINYIYGEAAGNYPGIISTEFKETHKDINLITNFIRFYIKDSIYNLIYSLEQYFKHDLKLDYRIIGATSDTIYFKVDKKQPLLLGLHLVYSADYYKCKEQSVNWSIIGDLETCKQFIEYLKSTYRIKSPPAIDWYYKDNQNKVVSRSVVIEKPNTVRDVFYPYLNTPVDKYLEDYLNSSATTLVLMGEPGTGKTSLIRYFIHKYSLSGCICYDEEVIGKDEMFMNFLFNKETDIMVIEDADLILSSREDGGNKLMSRFLNISDGLIKLPKKKIVFTTNIRNINQLDQALIRPGRCYDCVTFRALTYDEAVEVCKEMYLERPQEEKSYTLTDLFNPEKPKERIKKFGF